MQELAKKIDDTIKHIDNKTLDISVRKKLIGTLSVLGNELEFLDRQFDYVNTNLEHKNLIFILLNKINKYKSLEL